MNISFEEARGARVLVALSGGADSVALFTLLYRAREAGILEMAAAHYEHGIRGEESKADAEFCRKLCEEHNVIFIPGRGDVPEIARRTGEGLETCARRLRYTFLNEAADILDAKYIALAHHMDDQAETVLMHLLRGCGPEGIGGMRRVSGRLYRPLLNVRKSEITAFLAEIGQTWREDGTNAHADNPRNALRLKVMPALEETYPGCAEAISRYAEAAAVESDYVGARAKEFYEERTSAIPGGWRFDLSGGCDEALLRRTLRRICGPDLTSAKLSEITALKTSCDVFGGLRAERCGDRLYIYRPITAPRAALININGETELDGICRVSCAPSQAVPERRLKSTQVLDKRAIDGAVLRTRVEGDRISPLGMTGSKSLSDYFTDLRVDRPMRDIVPIIARGSEVSWAIGFGISRECALNGGEAVRLECKYEGWGGFTS